MSKDNITIEENSNYGRNMLLASVILAVLNISTIICFSRMFSKATKKCDDPKSDIVSTQNTQKNNLKNPEKDNNPFQERNIAFEGKRFSDMTGRQ